MRWLAEKSIANSESEFVRSTRIKDHSFEPLIERKALDDIIRSYELKLAFPGLECEGRLRAYTAMAREKDDARLRFDHQRRHVVWPARARLYDNIAVRNLRLKQVLELCHQCSLIMTKNMEQLYVMD
jgi:hypothetical protein